MMDRFTRWKHREQWSDPRGGSTVGRGGVGREGGREVGCGEALSLEDSQNRRGGDKNERGGDFVVLTYRIL